MLITLFVIITEIIHRKLFHYPMFKTKFPFFCKKCKTTTLVEYGLSLSQRA